MSPLAKSSSFKPLKVLGGASQLVREAGGQLADGEMSEEMLAEDGGPGAVEEATTSLAEVLPGVEEVAGLVMADGEHEPSIAPPAGTAKLFAGPSTFGYTPGGTSGPSEGRGVTAPFAFSVPTPRTWEDRRV